MASRNAGMGQFLKPISIAPLMSLKRSTGTVEYK